MKRSKAMTFAGKGEAWKATYVVTHQDKVNAQHTIFQDELGGKLKLQYLGEEPLNYGKVDYRLEDMTDRFVEGEIVMGTDEARMKETKGNMDYEQLLDMMNPNKDLTIKIGWNGCSEQFTLGLPKRIRFGKSKH
ncbi:hypothetical protein [Paenibacillus glucanolyticus]|uniref:hypothetical protein n=1 Tax=Paenibacillus glucanolyticus TaxID=59843 RepID=UPI0034D00678